MSRSIRLTQLFCLVLLPLTAILAAIETRAATSCTKLIPSGGAYDILRTSSSEEFHELLDDYFYKKDYQSHDEAIKDGFSVGFVVYGVPLKVGRTFSKEQKDLWKSEYVSRKKLKIDQKMSQQFEQLLLNVKAIQEITKCIIATEGFGVIADLEPTGDCTATFSASYHPTRDNERPPQVLKRAITVQGGKCDPWPKSVVSFGPTFVNCWRNERDALVVTINTKDATGRSVSIDAMPPLGSEPTAHDQSGDTFTKPAAIELTLYHDNFTYWNYPGTDRGDYRFTFYHDVTAPHGEPIQSLEYVTCNGCGAHFWPCPNGGICPHPFLEKLSETQWRVWALRNSDQPPIELKLKLNYFEKEHKCIADCGADVIHANWLAEKARTCPAVTVGPLPTLSYGAMFKLEEPVTGIPLWIPITIMGILIVIIVVVLTWRQAVRSR